MSRLFYLDKAGEPPIGARRDRGSRKIMLHAFNLNIDESFVQEYHSDGQNLHDRNKTTIAEKLDSFTNNEGHLIASKTTDNWFPQIGSNIFISHSHNDSALAIDLSLTNPLILYN
ncbi:MAG: hypothetical protein WCC64_15925 [Aliidongia sp.]